MLLGRYFHQVQQHHLLPPLCAVRLPHWFEGYGDEWKVVGQTGDRKELLHGIAHKTGELHEIQPHLLE